MMCIVPETKKDSSDFAVLDLHVQRGIADIVWNLKNKINDEMNNIK